MSKDKSVRLTPTPVLGRPAKGFLEMGPLTGYVDHPARVFVRVQDDDTRVPVGLFNGTREDFLEGAAAAFDLTIIENSDLYPVQAHTNGTVTVDGSNWGTNLEQHERMFRRHLSIAAHIRANPPVDKEALDALTAKVKSEWASLTADQFARRLYDQGVRVVSD